ncbi:MAG: response regulator transcription factor, partial [Deltaproteobacteria bacterium]|nr:response regulator transcription factor [Deltaproteobacteria bacterium]
GQEALEKVETLKPKVAVIDLNLPGLNGIEVIRRLRTHHPQTLMVVLSVHMDEAYVYRALEAGASAYVVKQGAARELIEAIEAVVSGYVYLCPLISRPIVQAYIQRVFRSPSPEEVPLTSREQEVLQLLAEGLNSKEIAQRLQTSTRTIDVHRQHIMNKLDLHTLPKLVKYAIRKKLIFLEE